MTLQGMSELDLAFSRQTFSSWLWSWWIPISFSVLREAEKTILSSLKVPYKGFYVDVGSIVGDSDKIWTVSQNVASEDTPILLLHGLGAGLALWALNFDAFSADRPVYAIDLLGFGRSSRPQFSKNDEKAEEQLVLSIEEWRKKMKLNQLIILGHNVGGFLATSYALKYPNRVTHLILEDPWGFLVKPNKQNRDISVFTQVFIYIMSCVTPLFAVRAAGPIGRWLVEKTRPDLIKRLSTEIGCDRECISNYIYQCAARSPTGEQAFQAMSGGSSWARHPMINRLNNFKAEIPLTIIYGSRTLIDWPTVSDEIRKKASLKHLHVQAISGAGNYAHADKSELFNAAVLQACKKLTPNF